MHVELLTHTPEPEKVIAAAAKLCYSASDIKTLMEDLTPEKVEAFIKRLADYGHESPIEHVTFTFGIEGVSRSLLAQITRHRIGSYSVKSQRYVKEGQFEYVTPDEIENDPEAKQIYVEIMKKEQEAYDKISNILFDKYTKINIESGMDEKTAKRNAEKKAIENARYVLPNACTTKIITTMNARSLFNFFSLRCCNRAQDEIRDLADEMLKLCKEVSPILFKNAGAPCVKGKCPEGSMSCGKPRK